jgi:hypothetical protein
VKLREYALTRGIEAAGMSGEDLKKLLDGRKAGFEEKIVAIEGDGRTKGTSSSNGTGRGGVGGAIGGVAGGLGGIVGRIGNVVGSVMDGASGLADAAGATAGG